jgi:hypothetical protein
VNDNTIGDTVIIFGIAVLVVGWFLSIPILGTTGGILLTVGLIVWILRQSQSVVLGSLRLRYSTPPPRVSRLSPTVPIEGTAPISARRSPYRMDVIRHTEWT